ncbi:uncharacterized protein A4U43_C08F20390, partial [Asparagus officinalis]
RASVGWKHDARFEELQSCREFPHTTLQERFMFLQMVPNAQIGQQKTVKAKTYDPPKEDNSLYAIISS